MIMCNPQPNMVSPPKYQSRLIMWDKHVVAWDKGVVMFAYKLLEIHEKNLTMHRKNSKSGLDNMCRYHVLQAEALAT